jgi:type IV secretory pathway VirB10-like protein
MHSLKRLLLVVLVLEMGVLACRITPSSESNPDETSLARDIEATVTAMIETEQAQPTEKVPDTPTSAPSATPVPTNQPTDVPAETPPPLEQPSPQPSIATVEIINGISRQLTVIFKGPETRSFIIRPNAKMEVELLPGEYKFTLSAPGFDSSTGTVTFEPGENTWTIGKTEN